MSKKVTQLPLPLKAYYSPRSRGPMPYFKLTDEHLLARGFFNVYKKGPYSRWHRYVDFSFQIEQIELLAIGTVLSLTSREVNPDPEYDIICFRGWPSSEADIDHIFRMLGWHPGPNKKSDLSS